MSEQDENRSDTTPEAAAFQAQLYAAMDPSTRLQTAVDLSVAARALTVAGLKRRNPGWSEERIRQRLLELCYGSAVR